MTPGNGQHPVLLAVTGASGSLYSLKFMEIMRDIGQDVHLVVSRTGEKVARFEIGDRGLDALKEMANTVYQEDDLAAQPASGSTRWRAMVILPCTMGTLAAVAHGGHLSYLFYIKVKRVYLTIDLRLPDPPCYQLSGLGTEIKDQYPLAVYIFHH